MIRFVPSIWKIRIECRRWAIHRSMCRRTSSLRLDRLQFRLCDTVLHRNWIVRRFAAKMWNLYCNFRNKFQIAVPYLAIEWLITELETCVIVEHHDNRTVDPLSRPSTIHTIAPRCEGDVLWFGHDITTGMDYCQVLNIHWLEVTAYAARNGPNSSIAEWAGGIQKKLKSTKFTWANVFAASTFSYSLLECELSPCYWNSSDPIPISGQTKPDSVVHTIKKLLSSE